MRNRVTEQFKELFLEAVTSKRASLNKMYIGESAEALSRTEGVFWDELRNKNPKLKREEIFQLVREKKLKGEIPHYEFAQKLADRPIEYIKTLKEKGSNTYDFVWADSNKISNMSSFSEKNSITRGREVIYKPKGRNRIIRPTRLKRLIDFDKVEIDGENYFLSSGFSQVLEYAELLNETGHLLIITASRDGEALNSCVQDLSLESLLNSRGYFINAIIGESRSQLGSLPSRRFSQGCIYIITRNDNGSIFVADLGFANDFPIEPLSKPNLEASETISHFGPEVPERIVKKMKQGDFPDPGDLEAYPPSSLDLLGKTPSEACKSILYFIDFNREEDFLHIQIFHDFDIDERDALLKSQVALYLEKHPLVLAFCSCSEKYGGTGAVFIHLSSEYSSPVITNFLSGKGSAFKGHELTEGYFISRKYFYSLSSERAKSEIAKNIYHYDGYKQYLFKELLSKDLIKDGLTTWERSEITEYAENKIGILMETNNRFDDADFPKVAITHESGDDRYNQYYYFPLDSEFLAEYVAIFLNSEIGRQIYLSHVKKDAKKLRFSCIQIEDASNLIILVPNIKEQERTIRAYDKVKELQISLDQFKEGLSQNPAKTLTEKITQIDDMLAMAQKLNFADRVRYLIRLDERGNSEFKETWKLPVKNEDDREEEENIQEKLGAQPFKAINAFINTRGGEVLIGVRDGDREIVGLEGELEHFFGKKDGDKKDLFKHEFDERLRHAFNLPKSEIADLVETEWGVVDGKPIFKVTCQPTDHNKLCTIVNTKLRKYLKHEAYQRVGANSIVYDLTSVAYRFGKRQQN